MVKVVLLPAAQRDLLRLRNFLTANDAAHAARRIGPAMYKGLARLAEFPKSAPLSAYSPIRQLHVPFGQGGYLVQYVYEDSSETVFVVTIRHDKEQGDCD